jgi:hypothetical protein
MANLTRHNIGHMAGRLCILNVETMNIIILRLTDALELGLQSDYGDVNLINHHRLISCVELLLVIPEAHGTRLYPLIVNPTRHKYCSHGRQATHLTNYGDDGWLL